jgi:hypothetical protein
VLTSRCPRLCQLPDPVPQNGRAAVCARLAATRRVVKSSQAAACGAGRRGSAGNREPGKLLTPPDASGPDWLGIQARAHALLSDGAHAEDRYREARTRLARDGSPARRSPPACTSARTRCSATCARSSPSWASQRAASLTASCPTRAQTASSARQGPAQGVVDSCNAVKVRRGCYFSSTIAWPLSRCSSAITPRNLPVVKSKATTWSWPTQ